LADEARIALVIQNLLENAIQYSPRGGEIVITIKQTNTQSVCWSIADQGLGVATNEQKNIFQKYYRAKNARDKRPGGTGIGLYVARGIVEHLGGKMYFISALGRGSTFSFTLPTHKKHKK